VTHSRADGTESTQLIRIEGNLQFVHLLTKLQQTFEEFVTIRHTLGGGAAPVCVTSEEEFDAFCTLVVKMEVRHSVL